MAEQSSISVLTPLLYVSVCVAALVIFAKKHRSRKLKELADTPQFYKHNYPKSIYFQLKQTEKVPPKLLKSAILAWAAEDITRIFKFREHEAAMANLLQNGIIGESVFERFIGSKILTERELQEIAVEANQLQPNWTTVLQTASETAQRNAVRKRIDQISVFQEEYYEVTGKPLAASS